MEYQNFCSSIHKVLGKVCKLRGKFILQHDLKFKNSIFQAQSSFAKDCRKDGGLFKCCTQYYSLAIFEKSRNSLIREGLIKDTPTSWCKSEGWPEVGRKRKDPCLLCFSDAMCTERDIETGKTKHTFIKKYKKEYRVMRWLFLPY